MPICWHSDWSVLIGELSSEMEVIANEILEIKKDHGGLPIPPSFGARRAISPPADHTSTILRFGTVARESTSILSTSILAPG